MTYTIRMEAVTKENKKVGGKGANLGEMIHAGLPIPPGFVVTTDAYDSFLAANVLKGKIDAEMENLDSDDPESVKEVAGKVQDLIMNGKVSPEVEKAIKDAYQELSVGKEVMQVGGKALDLVKAGRECFVAVRSSATAEDMAEASFAGQMKTILNVFGADNLVNAVRECWASIYTPRAIFYRKTHNITADISMGVIVQKMINSDKSGVIFTVDPTTNDLSKIMIEAAWGLGESVVSGVVSPDIYILDKQTGDILSKRVSNKKTFRTRDASTGQTVERRTPEDKAKAQVLNETEISKLWELAKKDEAHYKGKPQDIEWCEERNRIFFVQTRPVTTLGKAMEKGEVAEAGDPVVEGLGASPGVARGKAKVAHSLDELSKMEKGDILVARMTNPDMVPYMKIAAAIVTDEGGLTSHAAIVSRELGVPCIVGTNDATTKLHDGQDITVDAAHGKVFSGTVEVQSTETVPSEPLPGSDTPSGEIASAQIPVGFTATSIKANIAFPETAERVVKKADGVGLLRAEHMLTESGKHPAYLAREDPDELIRIIKEGIGKIAKVFYPKPVWYRTLDARTDEFRSLEGGENEPEEANPMLGWHGIRRSLEDPDVFRCELAAIKELQEDGLNNVWVMLPFVSKVEELRKAKAMVDFDVKFGIMVETPASVVELEEFCKEGIDFISIGSNDLTQLTLGIDRGNAHIAKHYDEMDPSVLRLIKMTIDTCKKYNVESSICGEAGSNPRMAEKLVQFGIDSISCEMDAIDNVRKTVAITERKILLDKIRER